MFWTMEDHLQKDGENMQTPHTGEQTGPGSKALNLQFLGYSPKHRATCKITFYAVATGCVYIMHDTVYALAVAKGDFILLLNYSL